MNISDPWYENPFNPEVLKKFNSPCSTKKYLMLVPTSTGQASSLRLSSWLLLNLIEDNHQNNQVHVAVSSGFIQRSPASGPSLINDPRKVDKWPHCAQTSFSESHYFFFAWKWASFFVSNQLRSSPNMLINETLDTTTAQIGPGLYQIIALFLFL